MKNEQMFEIKRRSGNLDSYGQKADDYVIIDNIDVSIIKNDSNVDSSNPKYASGDAIGIYRGDIEIKIADIIGAYKVKDVIFSRKTYLILEEI